MGDVRSYPLPEDPALADAASAIRDTGHWGWVVDERWRMMWASDEVRLSFGALIELASFEVGAHLFGPESIRTSEGWRMGSNSVELNRLFFRGVGGLILTDTPGGRDELRELVDPALRDIVDELTPTEGTMLSFTTQGFGLVGASDVPVIAFRVRDVNGRLAGTALISKPAAGMAMLSAMTFTADLGHVARMGLVAEADRRPAAILFADLEASSPLARRLSTASYFALGRRLVRASDQCVVDAGGLVGRHVGDGVGAFFLAETAGSESAAAYGCIAAARALRESVAEVAARTDLQPEDVVLRFGLHWGANLFVGNISTAGRSEVNALGDQVNEAARIEACASGGLALASKDLVERLDPDAAAALDLEPNRITYTPLGDLATATEKARRDAPAIAVCEI
ncbi:MAG TPA: adenylate/guanylate cyclase domain-containing protein [Candidatus Limnocylindrales bacterium]|nr:adenylate/guanylate cyclase domain-containing protein [Candidatus Limnocylindrales bacterium]